MTQLEEIFEELGLTQYLDSFLEQGFDTWETCLDIRESDFDALNVKLGHRRKLERRIAAYRGVDNRQALAPNKATSPPPDDSTTTEAGSKAAAKTDGKDGTPTNAQPTGKRKYRRHAKPDENAPERPPSAYVIFSNKMREDLKGRSLSFTEIAKLVGENWQTLSPAEKEPFEAQAFAQKEKYAIELAEYRQTENYKIYSEYLADFKAKQQYQLESKGGDDSNHDSTKRPKLENVPSQSSSNTVNSNSSGAQRAEEVVMQVPAGSKGRQSTGSVPHSWAAADAMAHQAGLPAISSAPAAMAQVRRDSVAGPISSIPWREQTRPIEGSSRPIELPIHGYARQIDTRPLQSTNFPTSESPHSYISRFPNRQNSAGGFTPPLLTTESTNSTVKSSISSGSGDSRISQSHYYAPRTPLDDPNRLPSLPIPSIYSGAKMPVTFEGTLPPIRHTSLSPTSSINVTYQPGGASTLLAPIQTFGSLTSPGVSAHDYTPGLAATQRSSIYPPNRFPPVSHQNHPSTLYRHGSSADDNTTPLDPIRALIDAGEIINNQQGHLQQKPNSNSPREQQQTHRHQQR